MILVMDKYSARKKT